MCLKYNSITSFGVSNCYKLMSIYFDSGYAVFLLTFNIVIYYATSSHRSVVIIAPKL